MTYLAHWKCCFPFCLQWCTNENDKSIRLMIVLPLAKSTETLPDNTIWAVMTQRASHPRPPAHLRQLQMLTRWRWSCVSAATAHKKLGLVSAAKNVCCWSFFLNSTNEQQPLAWIAWALHAYQCFHWVMNALKWNEFEMVKRHFLNWCQWPKFGLCICPSRQERQFNVFYPSSARLGLKLCPAKFQFWELLHTVAPSPVLSIHISPFSVDKKSMTCELAWHCHWHWQAQHLTNHCEINTGRNSFIFLKLKAENKFKCFAKNQPLFAI